MPSQHDDSMKQLIERAQNGDAEAVSELYRSHVDRIYRYVAYRVPTHEAEDITAEVFMAMVSDLPKYIYVGIPFEAWLYSIARTRVADFHRKRRQNVEEIDEHIADDTIQPEEQVVQHEDYHEVKTALSKLSESEQELLILRFVEHMSHDAVAEILGKSVAAVRTMQHRALVKLAQIFDQEGKEYYYLRGNDSPRPESDTAD